MKKLMFIFGTRPEFIKMYPVIKACQNTAFEVIIVNTGQHQEMLDELLQHFQITENYDLNIMHKCHGLTDIFCQTLKGLEPIMSQTKPDMVIVHGDTSATFAGALQAFYQQIPIAHIEAGLRTYNKYSPFPEEMNRQLTGNLADLHFTPTETTKKNLLHEGKQEDTIHVVGNSAIDMLHYTINDEFQHELLDWINNDVFILATVHRRENLADLRKVFIAFNQICELHPHVKIVYPMHMNPHIQTIAEEVIQSSHIKMIQPLPVIEFHNLMQHAHIILTDSGGIQEEAPALGKPVLVMRDTTERPEGVEAGTLKLIGTESERIVKEVHQLLTDTAMYNQMKNQKNPYGDGTTSQQIIVQLKKFFNAQ